MASKKKNEKDRKKPAATSSKNGATPKKTGSMSTNSKTKATPKKTAQATAKAKTAAKSKSPKRTEPKPPAKIMRELEELAKKHGAQADVPSKPAPKVNVSKSAETKIAPPKNGKVKEITVKYRFD